MKPLVIAGRAFQSRLIVGTGKYKDGAGDAGGHRGLGRGDGDGRGAARESRPVERVAAGLHRSAALLSAAEYGGLLHGGGGDSRGAAGARGGAVGLGEDRGDRRSADALSGRSGDARSDAGAGEGRLHGAAVYLGRHCLREAADRCGCGGGDAAWRADRQRAWACRTRRICGFCAS